MGGQVCQNLVAIKTGIYPLAAHGLHGAAGMDPLGQRAVHGRIGLMRFDKGISRQRQPIEAHHEQNRQHCQRDQPKLNIEIKHQCYDAKQQDNIAHRKD